MNSIAKRPFFHGMIDGTECLYGMRSRRYHVTTLRMFMVSKSRKTMILLLFYAMIGRFLDHGI
ncbi:hypothetical protein LL972_15875 [Xanthomonas campestris pv. asclepiadis]|uniref:hypothetical protein n=1 Tax=Xanthomonas campestris TaxID=339 RepID=UPI001E3C5258|nr:hypothetical protein [Xanthomonas campestris]MCC4617460.1 hypothetical protein [Xanthomonas campestris pv. asclepiadis]